MGTQTHVKFSRLSLPIAEALEALDAALSTLQIELRQFSRIEPTGEVDFPGYDAVGKLHKVRTVREVLDEVGRGESFAVVYLVGTPAYIYLNFFEFKDGEYTLLLDFDSSLLFYEDDENSKGQVLERVLAIVASALEAEVCGYNAGDRFFKDYDAITPQEILDGLRSGELLGAEPFFYALDVNLMKSKEVLALSSSTAAQYKLVRGTHHVLCAWPS